MHRLRTTIAIDLSQQALQHLDMIKTIDQGKYTPSSTLHLADIWHPMDIQWTWLINVEQSHLAVVKFVSSWDALDLSGLSLAK